eukprot:1082803-Prymnesium_polylepis.1
MYTQPRGRPRKDSNWDRYTGRWRHNAASTGTLTCPFRSNDPLTTPKDNSSAQMETTEDRQKETSTPVVATPPPPPSPKADPHREHVVLVAQSVKNTCPVYYLDGDDNLQEFGKERKRKPIPTPSWPRTSRRKIVCQVKVFGPNKERQLAEGEWELVDEERWV